MTTLRTATEQRAAAALTEEAAAQYTSVSRAYLRAARIGRCEGPPFLRIGRSVRYRLVDLDAWLAAHRVDARPARAEGRS
jgi:hypothetical protein